MKEKMNYIGKLFEVKWKQGNLERRNGGVKVQYTMLENGMDFIIFFSISKRFANSCLYLS